MPIPGFRFVLNTLRDLFHARWTKAARPERFYRLPVHCSESAKCRFALFVRRCSCSIALTLDVPAKARQPAQRQTKVVASAFSKARPIEKSFFPPFHFPAFQNLADISFLLIYRPVSAASQNTSLPIPLPQRRSSTPPSAQRSRPTAPSPS